MLEDIALLAGGRPIFKDLGIKLETVELADLGRAKKVRVDQDDTLIIEGAGDPADLSGRCKQIRQELEGTTSDYDREKLQERLAKLAGGVAQVNVAAATEAEMKEKKARFESALHAVKAAVEEGILPGGGVALIRAARALDALDVAEDERPGVDVVRKALGAPLKQIVQNGGFEGGVVLRKILAEKGANYGLDVVTEQYGDLIEAGVIDPTKVVRTALENGASVAAMLLMTDCLVTTAPEKEDEGEGEDEEEMDE
jgi:chaperonin GroEL